jgi:hypothetical protein
MDALIATMDRRRTDPGLVNPRALAAAISRCVDELAESFEQFDLVTQSELTFLSDDDLAKFSGFTVDRNENDR